MGSRNIQDLVIFVVTALVLLYTLASSTDLSVWMTIIIGTAIGVVAAKMVIDILPE